MKTTFSSLLLLVALILPLHADSPVPASSSIEIKMTRTVKIAEEPPKEEGHNCFANEAHYTLEPLFRRGQDAKTSSLILNLYIITTDTERKFAILKPVSQIIPSDPKIPLVTDASYHHRLQWRCKCRSRGDTMNREPEWYAEVTKDGETLCSTQSKSNSTINKLIATRTIVAETDVKALPVPMEPGKP